jgi:hypothetical protein
MSGNRGKLLIVNPSDENLISYVEPEVVFTLDLGTIATDNIPLINLNAPDPIFKDSEINITNSTITGLSDYVSNISETTNFNISYTDEGATSYQYNFNILGQPSLNVYTESAGTVDQYVIIQGTDSNSIIPGPIIRASDASNFLVIGCPSNGSVALTDITQATSAQIILAGGDGGSGTFVGLSVSNLYPSDNSIYRLPVNMGSNFDVMTIGNNVSGQLQWNAITHATSHLIPWSSWQYLVLRTATPEWVHSDNYDGAPDAGLSQRTYGSVDFSCTEDGSYRFTASFLADNNCGKANFNINLVDTEIECYDLTPRFFNFTWVQSLPKGLYPIVLSALTKNFGSSDYKLYPLFQGLSIIKI